MRVLTGPVAFYLLCAILLLGNLFFVLHEPWFGDFWHHVALVTNLKHGLWQSGDPFLDGADRLVPYWPYEALVSIFARLFGLDAVTALAIFSFINLTVLLFAARQFCRAFAVNEAAAVFVLLILGCWGEDPLNYSLFFHARVFFYVLPYPSTFAIALTLIATSRMHSQIKNSQDSILDIAINLVLSTVIVLVHPITWLLYLSVVSAMMLCTAGSSVQSNVIRSLATIVFPLLVWSIWPPFPLTAVIGMPYFSSDPDGAVLYPLIFQMTGPAIVGVLLIWWARPDAKLRPLLLSLSFLLFLVMYGYLSERWNYGRAYTFIMILLQFIIASQVVHASNGIYSGTCRLRRALLLVIVLVSFVRVVSDFSGVARLIAGSPRTPTLGSLTKLQPHLNYGNVIVAPYGLSKLLPAHGVKVLAFDVPPFFRDEYRSRVEKQHRFFVAETGNAERCAILKDFKSDTVMFDEHENPHILAAIGPILLDDRSFHAGSIQLVKVSLESCARFSQSG